MLSKRNPTWSYHAEQLGNGRWCLRARSNDGSQLRYRTDGTWAEESDGSVFESWRTQAEALAVCMEPRIISDTWAEIDGEAPAWDVELRQNPFDQPRVLGAEPSMVIPRHDRS